jgi:hypothetical protein
MAHGKSVSEAIEFYRRLGFEVGHTFGPEEAESPAWAWLESGDARMMRAAADEPVVASQQAVLLYPYGTDVQRARAELLVSGVDAGTKMVRLGQESSVPRATRF